jgi:signal transduction histidine kinase
MTESISSILEELREPQTAYLEPGLLSVFRIVVGLQLVLILLGFITVIVGRNPLPIWVVGTGALWLTLLLLYLNWPGLHARMGPWFLPPALIVAVIMPVIDRFIFLQSNTEPGNVLLTYDRIEDSGWRMLFFVLFPLVLTAWQYGMPQVLLYAFGIALISFGLNGWATGWTPLTTISAVPMAIGQSVVLTLIGYVVVRMIAAQREQRAKLTAANKQLADYAVTVDQLATSRERNRLARELHDTLSHTLSSLAVQLEAVESVWTEAPGQAHTLLVKSIANTRSGLAESRRALQALRASPLEDLGLGLALRNLAESTATRAGLELTEKIPKQIEGLSPEAEQCIYRVAQEALDNVVRHAQAKEIRVALCQQATGHWQLTVDDNGRGFDASTVMVEGHYGLQGMQERATVLGGSLEISSQPASGTRIRLVL